MSLILDALNRSRQESTDVPGLATQHFESAEQPGGGSWRVILPWVALAVAVGVIAWLVLDRARGPEVTAPLPAEVPMVASTAVATGQPPVAPAPAAAEVAPARPTQTRPLPAAEPVTAPRAAAPAAKAPAENPPVIVQVRDQAATADPEVAALYERQAPGETAPDKTQPVSAGAAAPVKAAPAGREEQPVDLEKQVARARQEMENARLSEHPAPFIIDLSQQKKDAIPTIFYQRHDYAGDSAGSTVMLNDKTLRVGGTVAPGVKVVEILPDSVVLSHDGAQFRLRALNSWVNL